MIAVVPARGNSKEVRRKNLQIVDGKPLLCHIADTIRSMGIRVVVSTEDAEISSVAKVHGYEVHHRDPQLSEDGTPVVDVAAAVVHQTGYQGPVLIAQPTVPFVTRETLSRLVNLLGEHDAATLVTPNTHLLRNDDGRLTEPRNRQSLTGLWREVGVRVFSGNVDTPPTGIIEVTGREALDIDTIGEMRWAQQSSKTIEISVVGNKLVGSGHVHRGLALANELQHHDIIFTLHETDDWVQERIEAAGYPIAHLSWPPVDLAILDILDTDRETVGRYHANGSKVVTIEDMGAGSLKADLVVNAMYQYLPDRNEVNGPKWADLRPEFVGLPAYTVWDNKRVLTMFGGTDPSNLGERVASLLRKHDVTWLRPGDQAEVAYEMMNHDILVTSAGRTVYEAASVGIPTVVVAQNAREATHAHLGVGNLYLGVGSVVTDDQIVHTVANLLADHQLRQDLSDISRATVDGKGLQRIAWAVEGLLRGM